MVQVKSAPMINLENLPTYLPSPIHPKMTTRGKSEKENKELKRVASFPFLRTALYH